MCDTQAILTLRRKRAYLAGEIAQAERQLAEQRKMLATLDGTIQLFAPATNPELIAAIRPTRGACSSGRANRCASASPPCGRRDTRCRPVGGRVCPAGETAADR